MIEEHEQIADGQDCGLHQAALEALATGHRAVVRQVARRVARSVSAEIADLHTGADRRQLREALVRAGERLLQAGTISDRPATPQELAAWADTARLLEVHSTP